MISIDRCLINKIFRAPTQVNFHGICGYSATYVKLVLYIIFVKNQFSFIMEWFLIIVYVYGIPGSDISLG